MEPIYHNPIKPLKPIRKTMEEIRFPSPTSSTYLPLTHTRSLTHSLPPGHIPAAASDLARFLDCDGAFSDDCSFSPTMTWRRFSPRLCGSKVAAELKKEGENVRKESKRIRLPLILRLTISESSWPSLSWGQRRNGIRTPRSWDIWTKVQNPSIGNRRPLKSFGVSVPPAVTSPIATKGDY